MQLRVPRTLAFGLAGLGDRGGPVAGAGGAAD